MRPRSLVRCTQAPVPSCAVSRRQSGSPPFSSLFLERQRGETGMAPAGGGRGEAMNNFGGSSPLPARNNPASSAPPSSSPDSSPLSLSPSRGEIVTIRPAFIFRWKVRTALVKQQGRPGVSAHRGCPRLFTSLGSGAPKMMAGLLLIPAGHVGKAGLTEIVPGDRVLHSLRCLLCPLTGGLMWVDLAPLPPRQQQGDVQC